MILQYILQYGLAVLQYIAIDFLPYHFTPTNLGIFIQCGVTWMSESHQKRKTAEEKEDEAHARDIAMLQIKAYKHFLNVMLMYCFVC